MRDQNYLFSTYDLRVSLEEQTKKLEGEIDDIEKNRLLNSSFGDLVAYFIGKYQIEAPRLLDTITVDLPSETQVDARAFFDRYVSDPSRPFYIPATKITYYVPFEGDANLFRYRSSALSYNPPRAIVGDKVLIMSFTITNHDGQEVKKQFEGMLAQIQQLLLGTHNDVTIYNDGLKQKVETKLKARKDKILKDHTLAAELGYPLRKRDDAPMTYAVPLSVKKIIPQMPPSSTAPFQPEPSLEWGDYTHILDIISNMVAVIERSPATFANIKEEDLRHHFLVQLNGQYNGSATGETFNAHGKTDILVRVNGKNIFIAECKFWKGKEYLIEGIDQLLGYTSWRDTKTAVLLFNRNKNLTDVLAQIPVIFKEHPNFKREEPYNPETGFRFLLSHNDDPNREIFVTVLVFEMPKEDKE